MGSSAVAWFVLLRGEFTYRAPPLSGGFLPA